MNIKYIRKIMILSVFGALLAGCDTSEDLYKLGDETGIKLNISPEEDVEFGADADEKDIEVLSTVTWNMEKTFDSGSEETWLTVEPVSNRGNGVLSVKTTVNKTGKERSARIILTSQGFNLSRTINVTQAGLVFLMDSSKGYPVAPETGGTVELTFQSSIAWTMDPDGGSLSDCFENPSDFVGTGSYLKERKINAQWTPNYTTEERMIKLQLMPQDEDQWGSALREIMPDAFTLRQEAGTFPEISGIATVGTPTLTDAVLSVSYASKSPVTEVGVIINGSKVAAPAGTYQETGSVEIPLTGLASGHTYEATPYVINRVGEKIGEQTASFTTERPVGGASIINVNVIPSYKSVQAEITVDSDCELVGGGIAIYGVDNPDYQLVKYTKPLSGKSQTFTHGSVEWMDQNTEYLLEPFVIYRHSKENVEIEVTGDKISFYTLFRIPEEDDNKPIE